MTDEDVVAEATTLVAVDPDGARELLEGLFARPEPPTPEIAWECAQIRRELDTDDHEVIAWYEAALGSSDPTIVARAHARVGYLHSWQGSPDGIPHLRIAMASGIDDEPTESALYLAYLVDDDDEAEHLFRLALDNADRIHRAEAALGLATLFVERDPDAAAAFARCCYSWGEQEDRVAAMEVLRALGHDEPEPGAPAVLPPSSTPATGWRRDAT